MQRIFYRGMKKSEDRLRDREHNVTNLTSTDSSVSSDLFFFPAGSPESKILYVKTDGKYATSFFSYEQPESV